MVGFSEKASIALDYRKLQNSSVLFEIYAGLDNT